LVAYNSPEKSNRCFLGTQNAEMKRTSTVSTGKKEYVRVSNEEALSR